MNKIKKVGMALIIFLIAIMSLSNISFAAHDTNGKYLGLYEKGNGRKTGYYTTGTTTMRRNEIPVIKIVEYTNSAGTTQDQSKVNQAIYCLKDGVGFGSQGSSSVIEHYTEYFDLKAPNAIPENYKRVLPTGNNYNKLIWLLDNICIPEDSASVQNLLDKADVSRDEFGTATDEQFKDIIEVIQQAAIWYITNAGDDYQPSKNNTFRVADIEGGVSKDFYAKFGFEDMVDDPATKVYDYLINGAAAQENYQYQAINSQNLITFNKSNATVALSNGNYLVGPYNLTRATSDVNLTAKVLNGNNEEIQNVKIVKIQNGQQVEITGNNTTEKVISALGTDFYIQLPANTSVTQVKLEVSGNKEVTTQNYWSTPENRITSSQPVVIIEKNNITASEEDTKNIVKPNFDLALRKFITQIAGKTVSPSREPQITQENLRALATGSSSALDNGTTAQKVHPKNSLPVKTGNKIVYTIRVYNEGEIDGYAQEITDYLPDGLKLVPSNESEINAKYGWQADANNEKIIRTTYLSKEKDETGNLIKAFDKTLKENGEYNTLSYKDVEVECEVVATTESTDKHMLNIAEISSDFNSAGVADRDSVAGDLTEDQKAAYAPGTSTQGKGFQDDDDYEDLVLQGKYFDVALRKFITAVNNNVLRTNNKYDREPEVDVSPLFNGKTTASYKHTKLPVSVSAGDIVTYTIRVYNEGQIDGYVDEIVDHLPPELEFLPDDELNQKYLWTIDSQDRTQRTIRTTYLSKEHDEDNIIEAFDPEEDTLSYKEVEIRCKVVETAPALKKLTNIAEITKSSNDANMPDRDNEKNVIMPQDSALPDYKGKEENKEDLSDKNYHYEGQEDDDDFEKLILEKFDLALRKFITGVNNQNVTNREPQVDTSKYGTIENGKEVTTMTYNHPKDPVRVEQNDVVIYTIRIYNEGTKSGYAAEIKDDIPEGLMFLVDNEINNKYRWVMYDKDGNVTDDPSKAVTIRTDYLSKEQEENEGDNLLEGFNPEEMDTPDYLDVQVAFKVTEPNTSDRIIINHAEISKDTDKNGEEVDDIDSIPNEWNEGEDDQDIEKIYVKYFDLALRKWVSQAILIEDGIQKEMDTNHYAEQDPEPVVKVELNKDRIENTIVKFRYQIRITNEGEIAGYATEISDYIPDGLKFNQADNPKWKEVNGKIVTDQLKDTLLQPGEAATIEVVLTWINGEENLNQKVNVAEISKDYNESGTPDIDSTPNNKKPGEDDIDDAPVVLTVVTGSAPTYIALITGTILIIGLGVFAIKKYVI